MDGVKLFCFVWKCKNNNKLFCIYKHSDTLKAYIGIIYLYLFVSGFCCGRGGSLIETGETLETNLARLTEMSVMELQSKYFPIQPRGWNLYIIDFKAKTILKSHYFFHLKNLNSVSFWIGITRI